MLMLASAMSAQAAVRLSSVFGSGMVLQREQPLTISGTAEAGETVSVAFVADKKQGVRMPKVMKGFKLKASYTTSADADGKWSVQLPPLAAGGPYILKVNDQQLTDMLVGDVWLCSGQSNMELPVRRVMDMFADTIEVAVAPKVRLFQVKRVTAYDAPMAEVQTDGWKSLNKQNAYEFSALAYFYALEMHRLTGIPQGVVQAAVGGTPIEAWMSREYLADFPMAINKLDINSDAQYRQQVEAYGSLVGNRWENLVAEREKALGMNWTAPAFDDAQWHEVDIFEQAGAVREWSADSMGVCNGAHWFRKTVTLTAEQASQNATLRLGCLVDADQVYVNGTFVGSTGYRYPPRMYSIPVGTLREGENVIAIRLLSQGGRAQAVPEKYHGIFFGNSPWLCGEHTQLDIDSKWRHMYAVRMPAKQGVPFFYYTPTVLYNGMLAPLAPMRFAGALWYQGESNVGQYKQYGAMLRNLMACWRERFAQPDMPFAIVELADYSLDEYDHKVSKAWRSLQKAQHDTAVADGNAVPVSAQGLGEWNDIHPLNKKHLAERIAAAMHKMMTNKK